MAAPTRRQLWLVWWFIVVKCNASFTFKLSITCPEVAGICKSTASGSVKTEGSPNKCKQSTDSSKHLLHLKGPMTFSNYGISERGIAELAKTKRTDHEILTNSEHYCRVCNVQRNGKTYHLPQNTWPSSLQRASCGHVICCFNIMLTRNM